MRAQHLAHVQALVRSPRSRLGPCQEQEQSRTPPQCFGGEGREKGERAREFHIPKECSLDAVESHDCQCPTALDLRSWQFHAIQPNQYPASFRTWSPWVHCELFCSAGILICSALRIFAELVFQAHNRHSMYIGGMDEWINEHRKSKSFSALSSSYQRPQLL